MFGFFRRKKTPTADAAPADATRAEVAATEAGAAAVAADEAAARERVGADADASTAPATPAASVAPADTVPDGPVTAAPRDDATQDAVAPEAAGGADPAVRRAPPVGRDPADAPASVAGRADAPATVAVPAPLAAEPPPTEAPRKGWMARLRQGLSRTRGNLASIFVGVKVDAALYEELEAALLASDAGYATTRHLLSQLEARARRERITDAAALKTALRECLVALIEPLERPIVLDRARPLVMMIAGVNGAGKTTSIGKLARHLRALDQSVLLAAGDTFRAAAREQLTRWGERNDVQVIAGDGADPAAVAFDAVKAGIARGTHVVMIDTAGRLPTQANLMAELKKIRRVIGKAMEDAPHEVLLVLDGNTGQNMLAQVQAFDEAVGLTGLIVTKLDGTAKGGAIAALAHTRADAPIPVYFIGVGEGVEDLEAFSAREFAQALLD